MSLLKTLPRQVLASLLCAAGLLTFSATAQAPNDVRIALIIGNSAYPGNMALANPSNDAKDMAATLRNMGFGVVEVLDGNRAQMMDAIERANKQLQGKQGVGMLFYAGHGLQLDWRNYMVPVDAKLSTVADVPKQTVDIEVVMKSFQQAGNRMNIVVLDACRDDPFANGKTSTGKGLAPLDAPTGTFLAYATAPGNVAQDGTGKNGLYTSFLLQELQKPTARIEDVFKRVRFAVRKASNGAQIPWETTSLEDDFVFNSGIKKVVKLTDSEKDKEFNIEKADWDKIKDSKSADPFYAFVQKYPNGLLTASAQGAIDRLNEAKTLSTTDKAGKLIESSSVGKYIVGTTVEVARTDGLTNVVTHRVNTIVSVQNGLVSYSDGTITTTSGETVRAWDGRTFDPPQPIYPPSGLVVGKEWLLRVGQTPGPTQPSSQKGWVEAQGKILTYEDVTVPAGTFKAYKFQTEQMFSFGLRNKRTIWYSNELNLPLKVIYESRSGNYLNLWTEEAVAIKRGS